MKPAFLLSIGIVFNLVFFCESSFCQAPESINYQAVVRDNSGNPVANQSVRFRLSILQGSPTGTVVYSESQLKITNQFGLATLAIGSGTILSGTFNSISWGSSTYYLETEFDPSGGSSYQVLGITQFLSVPFALYAKSSGGTTNGWSLTGNTGINPATNFIGTTDNVPLTFRVNNQKSGIIDPLNGNNSHGYQALLSNSGAGNTAFGYKSLKSNLNGNANTAIGDEALNSNGYGSNNTASGISALHNNTIGNFNTANGSDALYYNTEGEYNAAFGARALFSNFEGWNNTATGFQSLSSNLTGQNNTAAGASSLGINEEGNNNAAFGANTLNENSSGSDNTAIGYMAGYKLLNGNNNIFLGSSSGPLTFKSIDNTMWLGKTNENKPAIYGDLTNGQIGIGTSTPSNSAILDLTSNNKGLLIPRMTHSQLMDIPDPAEGLLVYCSDCGLTNSGRIVLRMGGTWQSFTSDPCIKLPEIPVAGTHNISATQITWNWNPSGNVSGYKWSGVNDYSTAIDIGTVTTKTEVNLFCGTTYVRYLWAINACGHSEPLILNATTTGGTPLTYPGSSHTECECVQYHSGAGYGQVVTVTEGGNQYTLCKFNYKNVPTGWTQAGNWQSYNVSNATGEDDCNGFACTCPVVFSNEIGRFYSKGTFTGNEVNNCLQSPEFWHSFWDGVFYLFNVTSEINPPEFFYDGNPPFPGYVYWRLWIGGK